jgi:hypothetical protein
MHLDSRRGTLVVLMTCLTAKDNDLKIISKLFEFFAEGQEIERSRTFLEINYANGREFR